MNDGITYREAAKLLGTAKNTISFYVARGDLKVIAIRGRAFLLSRAAVEAFKADTSRRQWGVIHEPPKPEKKPKPPTHSERMKPKKNPAPPQRS